MSGRLHAVILAVAAVLLAGAGLVVAGTRSAPPPELAGHLMEPALEASDFTLESGEGPVTLSDFRGQVVALFFGYTRCPDVCPLTMARLAQAVEALGEDAGKVQGVLVSIDPERDAPADVSAYAARFDPSFVGLSGAPESVESAAMAFGVYHGTADPSAGPDAPLSHSATVTVLDPEGRVRLLWSGDVTAGEMAADLAWMVGSAR